MGMLRRFRDVKTSLRGVAPGSVAYDATGYDIVILAGQSNMAGRGASDSRLDPQSNPRIWSYGSTGTYAGRISLAVDPLSHRETAQTGLGPANSFGQRYVQAIPGGRSLVYVPVAYGDTGFQTTSGTPGANQRNPLTDGNSNWTNGGSWRVNGDGVGGNNLFTYMIQRAQAALAAAPPGSRIVAVLWHQGEADTYANSKLTQSEYATVLDELILAARTQLNEPNLPFIVGTMLPEWVSAGATQPPVDAALADTPRRNYYTACVITPTGYDHGDGIHISAAGQRLNGVAYYDALQRAKTNFAGSAPGVPGMPTMVQTAGTSVSVTWLQATGNISDYNVRYSTNGGSSWTDLVRSQSLKPSATLTISLGATVLTQVRSVNGSGVVSDWSASGTLTLLSAPGQVTGLALGTAAAKRQDLTWTAVTGATSYKIEYKASASGTWLNAGTVTTNSGAVGSLTPSTSYDYRVSAINLAGTGTVSSTATGSTAAADPLFGVSTTGATPYAAYSLRKLFSGYAGSAIQVRRSSDSTTQDIGFISGEDLDQAALLTFVGAGDATIVKIYDQSGNTRDMVAPTTGAEPAIVTAGVVLKTNGIPMPVFNGTTHYLTNATMTGIYAAGAASSMSVASATSITASTILWSESGATARYMVDYTGSSLGNAWATLRNTASTLVFNAAGTGGGVWANNVLAQVDHVDTGTTMTMHGNGFTNMNASAVTRSGTFTMTNVSIGAVVNSTPALYWSGRIAEVVIYTSAINETVRGNGRTNQKTYYGTP